VVLKKGYQKKNKIQVLATAIRVPLDFFIYTFQVQYQQPYQLELVADCGACNA
jgi:hypothetical protein